jgi:hypothetical protein
MEGAEMEGAEMEGAEMEAVSGDEFSEFAEFEEIK